MEFLLGTFVDLVSSSGILIAIALGFYLVFGVMRVYNMAHGEFVMIGAYATALSQDAGLGLWSGVIVAPVVCGLLAIAVEFLAVRHLYGKDNLSTLLVTWGVSLCLIQGVRLLFGPSGRFVELPVSSTIEIVGAPIPVYNLYSVLFALLLVLVTGLLYSRTTFGVRLRATIEDDEAAELAGINTSELRRWTFVYGGAVAGFAGALVAPVASVTPFMGVRFTVLSVLAVLVGGRNTIWVPIVGGLVVGGGRSVLNAFSDSTIATVVMLLLVVTILLVRPGGILR